MELLFGREVPGLRRWARGRLPRWARTFVDTADLVQDVVARTLPNLARFEPQREKALRAYLRSAVDNRIRDELRRVHRSPRTDDLDEEALALHTEQQSPLDQLLATEDERLLANALATLSHAEQTAIVARLRLGYSFEQVALLLQKRSPDAARMLVTRAIAKLIETMRRDAAGPGHG